MRYRIGDRVSLIDHLGHTYRVMARYYCQTKTSRQAWLAHATGDQPVYDRVLVNMDTGLVEHVIITHADDDGIIPCEAEVDRIIGYDGLMTIRLITCHPEAVRQAYPFWVGLIYGDWSGKTYVMWDDGILYVCAEIP